MLVCVGGALDPNINGLHAQAVSGGLPHLALLMEASVPLRVMWDLVADRLTVEGQEIKPTAMFLRQDVFAALDQPNPHIQYQAQVWYETFLSWALVHEEVRLFNRHYRGTHKATVLRWAQALGLDIPYTLVTNLGYLLKTLAPEAFISKPLLGGQHTTFLGEALAQMPEEIAPYPSFIQPTLMQPELRIFVIAETALGFWMKTTALDYRVKQDVTLEQVEPPAELVEKMKQLMQKMGLTFAASDFKTDPETGKLLFLEINSNPMFAHFDLVSDYAISKALLQYLTDLPA